MMKKELDEDVYDAIKGMAETIDLSSRNYNDELIAIDYYKNIHVLTEQQLNDIEQLWQQKCRTCYKEMLASRWMVVQIMLLISFTIFLAWVSAGKYAVIITSILGLIAMTAMLEDKRVSIAKRHWQDAIKVHTHLAATQKKQHESRLKRS